MDRLLNVVTSLHQMTKRDYIGRMTAQPSAEKITQKTT